MIRPESGRVRAADYPAPRGFLQLLGGEAAARAISFVAIWWIAQRLGGEAYAPVAVALATMAFASLIVEFGFPLIGAREVARDASVAPALASRILSVQLAVAAALCLLIWALGSAGLIAPALFQLLRGYGVSLILLPFLAPWLFQGLGAVHWIAVVGVLRQALFLAGALLIVGGPADAGRLPLAEIAAVAGAALIAQIGLRRLGVRVRVSWHGAFGTRLAGEVGLVGVSQFLWVVRMYLGTLMLWNAVPSASISNYDIAHRIMMVLQALLGTYFTNIYPAIARAVLGPRHDLHRLLRQSFLFTGGLTLGGAAIMSMTALPFLGFLFPNGSFANDETARCMAILVFVIPVLVGRAHARMTLLAMSRVRMELVCSVLGALILALVAPMWITLWGATGAALALLASEIFGTVATFIALTIAQRTGIPETPADNAEVGP